MGTTVVGAGCTMTCVLGGGGLLHPAKPAATGTISGKKWITRIEYSIKGGNWHGRPIGIADGLLLKPKIPPDRRRGPGSHGPR